MSNIYEQYTPPKSDSNGGGYFKPEDGKSIRARIVSEPVIFDSIYQGDPKAKPQTKYGLLIWNYDEDTCQVLVLPKRAFATIVELGREEDWGDPLQTPYDIKLKRTGKGTESVWTITPSPAKGDLAEDQKTQIESMNLIKMISSGNGVENVEWLRDVVKNGGKRGLNKQNTDNFNIEDIDESINLDDIPFGD